MSGGPLITDETIADTILPQLIKGTDQRAIAKMANCSQPAISLINQKLKSKIEHYQKQIAEEAAQYAVQNVILYAMRSNEVLNDRSISNEDISKYATLLTIAQKEQQSILQNLGISASHTGPATYIQNIYSSSAQPTDTEVNRFAEIIQARQDTDILDAEYTDELASLEDTD
jgi:hypothetical protein